MIILLYERQINDAENDVRNTKQYKSLKAQIAALEKVNTAESKAKLASLQAELAEKEDKLNDLKDDHFYDMQVDALDKFSEWLSEDTESKTKSLEYQKEIVEKLSQMTEGYNINDTVSELEQFYLGLGRNDSIFNGHDITVNTNTDAKAIQSDYSGDLKVVPKGEGLQFVQVGSAVLL